MGQTTSKQPEDDFYSMDEVGGMGGGKQDKQNS